MRAFLLQEDAMGQTSAILGPSDSIHAVVLEQNIPKSVPVPANARTVIFNGTGPFWVRYDAIPVVPTQDVLDGSAPELNPAARSLEDITTIGLVTRHHGTVVTLTFYA